MTITSEEKKKLKETLLSLVKRKAAESGNHCGFGIYELIEIMEILEYEGLIKKRQTANGVRYHTIEEAHTSKKDKPMQKREYA